LYGVRADHPGNALRAAVTASLASLREAVEAFARNFPVWSLTTWVRPDSERGKAPPTYSL
jgi:hypothetical protein